MPTTPFIGISLVIHVGIIAFHKLFRIKPRVPKPVAVVTNRQYVFSAMIVVSMFSVMLFTAFGLISASIHERHSTVYLVEDTAQWVAQDNGGEQIIAAVGGQYRTQALALAAGVLILIGIVYAIPRVRMPQSVTVSQGGYSAISVSLLISGLLILIASSTYITLYLLITYGGR